MLYKVTPAMTSPEQAAAPAAPKKEKKARGPRKKRKSAVYDAEGNEVLISLTCLKCKNLKPLAQFGLRKMGDGAIRNQPWCRGCRAGAGTKGKKPEPVQTAVSEAQAPDAQAPAGASPAAPDTAAAPVKPVAAPVASRPAEASAGPEQKAAPAAAPAPQQEAPTSPWMAAIASLRAVVGRPSGGGNDRSGSGET